MLHTGEVSDARIVGIQRMKGTSNIHKLYAECAELGEQEVTLTVGNKKTVTNKHPAHRTATVKYVSTVLPGSAQRPPTSVLLMQPCYGVTHVFMFTVRICIGVDIVCCSQCYILLYIVIYYILYCPVTRH